MIVTRSIDETRKIINALKNNNKSIGFVPTMGALHKGHLALMERSISENEFTVVSVFVNPIQFGKNEDFSKYPRPIEKDLSLCKNIGVDMVFAPEPGEMTKDDMLAFVDIEKLQNNLCGLSRPGHFRGVCTIVAKFFNIIKPTRAYFGKKDIQQFIILKKMAEDLNFDIEIVACDIFRETDGLAMSSRNIYLSETERKDALVLYNALIKSKNMLDCGETGSNVIIRTMKDIIEKISYAEIDYIKIVNKDMQDIVKAEKGAIIALAVFFGKTRLIDNYIVGDKL